MDQDMLKKAFLESGYESDFIPFSSVNPADGRWKGRNVLYTSAEDSGLVYKQYIEDIVLALTYAGANMIPRFEFLRANNNKVFMELLRDLLPPDMRGNIVSSHFGTLEEFTSSDADPGYPVIIKGFWGAMGKNVFLARNSDELKHIIRRKISTRVSLKFRVKEHLRQIKHKGYQRESFNRGRFIVQKFIPGLKNDWKVYYFGDKAYVFSRPVFHEREFRASGGGYDNYSYGIEAHAPDGLLDFGWEIFKKLGVPNASLDIACDGKLFYLLEFQCLYFGTAGILKKYSSECFLKDAVGWQTIENEGNIEKAYAESVAWYLNNSK